MRLFALTLAAIALIPLGTFSLDEKASRLEFHVRDNRGGFTGVARDIEVRAVVRDEGESFAATVQVQVDARTMTTGIGIRDAQMRRDFLHTERFPFITFRGMVTPRRRPGGLPFPAVARGSLRIKETTREVEIPLQVTALVDSYLAEGEVTIRLSEFGIPIPRFLIFVAEDPVRISFKVRLTAQ